MAYAQQVIREIHFKHIVKVNSREELPRAYPITSYCTDRYFIGTSFVHDVFFFFFYIRQLALDNRCPCQTFINHYRISRLSRRFIRDKWTIGLKTMSDWKRCSRRIHHEPFNFQIRFSRVDNATEVNISSYPYGKHTTIDNPKDNRFPLWSDCIVYVFTKYLRWIRYPIESTFNTRLFSCYVRGKTRAVENSAVLARIQEAFRRALHAVLKEAGDRNVQLRV